MEVKSWNVVYHNKRDGRTITAVIYAKTYQGALNKAEKQSCGWSVVSVKPTKFDFPEE